MFKINVSPLVRISFGLAMLSASLVLSANYLGLVPNTEQKEVEHRKWITESLAMRFSSLSTTEQLKSAQEFLDIAVSKNNSLLSGAIRNTNNDLLIVSGYHDIHWNSVENVDSTLNQINVALFSSRGNWGTLELTFNPISPSIENLFSKGSLMGLTIFVSFVGFFAYMIFLKKVILELNSDNILPDRVSTAFDTLAAGIVIIEPDGYIIFSNYSFNQLLGLQAENVIGKRLNDFNWTNSSTSQGDDKHPWMHVLRSGKAYRGGHLELGNRHGKSIPLTVNATPIGQDRESLQGILVSFDDLSAIQASNGMLTLALDKLKLAQREVTEQNKKLHTLATRDPMTNALNRRSFFEGAEMMLGEVRSQQQELCFLMVDIDHFKSVNDTYGHGVGDKVIIFLYHCLSKHARPLDLVARFGGEEFCVAMPKTNLREAAALAEKMRLSVQNERGEGYPEELSITASFGVTILSSPESDTESLVEEADLALYFAKEHGRNQVACWPHVRNNYPPSPVEIEGLESKLQNTNPIIEFDSTKSIDTPTTSEITKPEPVKTETFPTEIAPKQLESLLLTDRIEQAVKRSSRYGTQVAIVSVDIELLQRINDTLGPAVGRKMSEAISDRIREALRDTDSILNQSEEPSTFNISSSGYRGMVLLLTDIQDMLSLRMVIERLAAVNAKPLTIEGNEYIYVAQMGISVYPKDGEDALALLRNANIAKGEAMNSGSAGNFCYFDIDIEKSSKSKLSLEADLYRSIERDELVLLYQPKANLETGELSGFEALIRWQHPHRGLVPPSEFIPIAESSGLIVDLGHWVIKSACQQMQLWQEQGLGNIPVAVNLSALELEKPNIANLIIQTLEECSIKPCHFEIEVTESIAVDNMDSAKKSLIKLSNAGIQITIDDFGTGYASLSYLQKLPINKLKIDRDFIKSLSHNANDSAIVSAVIAMGQTLDLTVIAEGVENAEQMQFLQDMQCNQIQGHYIHRPCHQNEAAKLIKDFRAVKRRIFENRTVVQRSIPTVTGSLLSVLNEVPGYSNEKSTKNRDPKAS